MPTASLDQLTLALGLAWCALGFATGALTVALLYIGRLRKQALELHRRMRVLEKDAGIVNWHEGQSAFPPPTEP